MSKVLTSSNKFLMSGGRWLTREYVPPEPPTPVLPPYTMRLRYMDGFTPVFSKGTGVQLSSSPNIWDLTYESNDWSIMFYRDDNRNYLLEVLGANTSHVTNMFLMLAGCKYLVSVKGVDTSSATNMSWMFGDDLRLEHIEGIDSSLATDMSDFCQNCQSLKSIPYLDVSSCTNMDFMFAYCHKVEYGMLDLYQRASSMQTVPSHDRTFVDCGIDTASGQAERAQIPNSWKF